MARATYVIRDGRAVPKHLAKPFFAPENRSELPAPHVIGDSLPDLVHPSNGKRYDSKKKFRDETRARGLTEVGNESFPERRGPSDAELRKEIAADVARVYDQLESGSIVAAEAKKTDLVDCSLAKVPDAV